MLFAETNYMKLREKYAKKSTFTKVHANARRWGSSGVKMKMA